MPGRHFMLKGPARNGSLMRWSSNECIEVHKLYLSAILNQAIDFSKNNQNKKYKKVRYTNALTFCES